MSRPSVGSSSTSNLASIAITRARCSWVTMPFDNSRTLLARRMVVFARKPSAFARSNRGCTPATYSSACETLIQRGSTATSAMKQTSRMSWSRSVQGSRPSTFSSPLYGVRPRIALSAVVLPAPLGPMSPRMRPSSTRKSTPSSAMVMPKVLRRPCASMHAMASALLLSSFRRPVLCGGIQQFFRCQAEPLNGCRDPGPLFRKKLLAFALQQQIARAGIDEHAEASLRLDKLLVDQLLIALQNRERIDPIFGRDIAHGRQGIAFFERAVEYHGDDTIAKLAVNWLTVVPVIIHPVFHHCVSYSDIVNYNTSSHVSFFNFSWPAVPAAGQRRNQFLQIERVRMCVSFCKCLRINTSSVGSSPSEAATQSEVKSQISDFAFSEKTLQDGRAFILQNTRSDLAAVVKHLRLQ